MLFVATGTYTQYFDISLCNHYCICEHSTVFPLDGQYILIRHLATHLQKLWWICREAKISSICNYDILGDYNTNVMSSTSMPIFGVPRAGDGVRSVRVAKLRQRFERHFVGQAVLEREEARHPRRRERCDL